MCAPRLPSSIRALFECSRKSELVKLAKTHAVTYDDLVYTLGWAQFGGIEGYHDFVTHTEWQPEEAELTESDRDIPRNTARSHEIGKFVRKMKNAFEVRKRIHYHMFYLADVDNKTADKWHLIYLTDADRQIRDNHWEQGPHFHFINHLWPNFDPNELHESFPLSRKNPVNGALHIRLTNQL